MISYCKYTLNMKKYIKPSCEEMTMEVATMLAESLGVYNDKTTTDGGWTRGQGWSADDWSAADTEE